LTSSVPEVGYVVVVKEVKVNGGIVVHIRAMGGRKMRENKGCGAELNFVACIK
jgi:hypothetical protein